MGQYLITGLIPNLLLCHLEEFQAELEKIEKRWIISKVTEPTEWVNSYVTVMKKNGDIRGCLGLSQLKKYVMNEYYPLPTVEAVASK